MALVLTVVCFWGRPSHLPVLLLGTQSKVRYEAASSFQYVSTERQRMLQHNARLATTPVIIVDTAAHKATMERYQAFINNTTKAYDELKRQGQDNLTAECSTRISEAKLVGLPPFLAKDLSFLIQHSSGKESFSRMMQSALSVLEMLLSNGIHEKQEDFGLKSEKSSELTDAERTLRNSMDSIAARESEADQELTEVRESLLSIFRPALQPNVRLDSDATDKKEKAAMAKIQPVIVSVERGDPLIFPGEEVTAAVLERWNAYRQQMVAHEQSFSGLLRAFRDNVGASLGILLLLGIYTKLVPRVSSKRRSISLAATMALANLALIRLLLDIDNLPGLTSEQGNTAFFLWMAPPALAAIIVTVLAGAHIAMLVAFLVSMFGAQMLGQSMEVLLITAFASLVGVYFSRDVRNRGAVVRASFLSGLAVAMPVSYICISHGVPWKSVLLQTLGCLASGLISGVFAIGLLHALERIFKITTNITLLELTDYNHPLLRKLQLIAPGTFHHSAMVANLAEWVAAKTDANALLCRCAALYHDIGKLVKPEYFVENQGTNNNPHVDLSPTVSALIIKSHVREGIGIAKEYKLPREIIDIIEQHHGTGLIQFFHHKAKQLAAASTNASPGGAVDEGSFRYDGPRPRTKESAIVLFADSVEAASRSLRKVTPQSVRELVDTIVSDRIRDGQLNLCPLTFREVNGIREGLAEVLLSMLHHRIEYPKGESQ
jgi:putative nucleotidyltransferase with HDIG domain